MDSIDKQSGGRIMMLRDFYVAAAELSFALLGFWWVVFGMKREQWLGGAATRRLAYHVSLMFLLPGIVSLASLLSESTPALWRLGFGLGGAAGLIATVRLINATRTEPRNSVPLADWLASGLLYALFVVPALAPSRLRDAGMEPLTVEGTLLTLQLLIGAHAAWRMFTAAELTPPAPPDPARPR